MKYNDGIILWIHGFAGKANNDTFREMVKRYPQYRFHSIEVDHHAFASLEKINQFIKANKMAMVAGTSCGGFYAICSDFAGPKLVVNPVVDPGRDLRQFLGMNTYKPGREDGQTDFEFTEDMLAEFALLKTKYIGIHDSPQGTRCQDVICHYTAHDQLLGEEIKEDYKRMFDTAKQIDEKVLPSHFLTFKYVKTAFGEALQGVFSEHGSHQTGSVCPDDIP